jgi:hypothetical protein
MDLFIESGGVMDGQLCEIHIGKLSISAHWGLARAPTFSQYNIL